MDSLRKVYNDLAKYYYDKTRSLWPEMKKWVVGVENKDRVLDVGCGEGRLLQSLGPSVNYTGIDFSEKLVDLAKTRCVDKKCKFIVGDITEKKVWDNLGKFDKIFAVAVLHHLPNIKAQLYVLKEMEKHLMPGGKIYISFWVLWRKKFWGEHFKNLKLKFKSLPDSLRWVEIPFANTKLKRFYFAGTKRYWERLLAQAGWKDAKISFDEGKKNMWIVLG